MKAIRYLSQGEWARRCGKTAERARMVLERGLIPDAVELVYGKKQIAFIVPDGTPWPTCEENWLPKYIPKGYLSLKDWAAKLGRNHSTVAVHFYQRHRFPEGTIRVKDRFFAIPENAPWPYGKAGQHPVPPTPQPKDWRPNERGE